MSMPRSYGLLLLFVLTSCSRAPDGRELPVSSTFANLSAAYTGDAVCFDCHQDQWTGYQEHGMARSFYRMTPEVEVEDFAAVPLWHAQSGFYYRVFARNGEYFQEEYRLDERNTKTHELTRRMDYVVGSGNAARTYLTESNGRLYEMPLTWFSQVSKWDFSPGYELFNKRFDRLVPDRCMACHNSYPESVDWVEGKYTDVPEGISCERCHGPGSVHVDARLEVATVQGQDLTIVNPAHLEPELQMDVCQQCHLQTTVSLLRDGREAFDFRPSQRLQDHLAFFTALDSTRGLDVISHAERLRQSACFVAATPDMTCTTCHNPHEGFRDKGPEYFNDTCMTCHEAPLASHEEDWTNCTDCHMPRVAADGTPHASFTDHWIRVVGNEPPEPSHEPLAMVPYYPRDQGNNRRMEAMATLVHGLQQADLAWVDRGLEIARPMVQYDSTGELQYLMGHALLETGRAQEALALLESALTHRPDSPERLNAVALAYERTGISLEIAEQLYRRALDIAPQLADVRLNYGRFLEKQGAVPMAIQQYQLAAQEKPYLADAHFNEGTANLQDGDFEAAEDALNRVLNLAPDHADALGNLGMLYLSEGRESEVGELFARAAAAAPDNPIALSNLGSWHFNRGNYREAISLLERSVALEPGYLAALVNLALAYARDDQMQRARSTAQQVLSVDPQNNVARTIIDLTGS